MKIHVTKEIDKTFITHSYRQNLITNTNTGYAEMVRSIDDEWE